MLTEQREAFSEQSQHCELHPSKAAESLSLTHPGKVKGSSSVRNCKQIKKRRKEMQHREMMDFCCGGCWCHIWDWLGSMYVFRASRALLKGLQWWWSSQPNVLLVQGIKPEVFPLWACFSNLWTTTTLQWLTVLCVSNILLLLLLSLCDLLRYCSFTSSCKNNLTMLMVIFRQT